MQLSHFASGEFVIMGCLKLKTFQNHSGEQGSCEAAIMTPVLAGNAVHSQDKTGKFLTGGGELRKGETHRLFNCVSWRLGPTLTK